MVRHRWWLLLIGLGVLIVGSRKDAFTGRLAGIADDEPEEEMDAVPPTDEGIATISFLDVGQGDSTLIQEGNTTILIDTGRHDNDAIFDHLEAHGVTGIDLLVFTHPHTDHIGNGDKIVEAYEPEEVWMDGNETTTDTFERLIDALLASNTEVVEPSAGETYDIGSFLLELTHPGEELSGDFNNDSVSFRMHYGDVSFLFTGDAEEQAEQQMIDDDMDISADVYNMGHHGSDTSSQRFFVEEVSPDVAVYSAGEGNPYEHPHEEVLQRVEDQGSDIYGTLEDGTVTVTTDGESLDIDTENEEWGRMKEKKPGVIDRIEDGYAVILVGGDEQELLYSASKLYEGAKEGDEVKVTISKEQVQAVIYDEKTKERKKVIRRKMNDLRHK
ncbi:MBL fold metallo-hydrolase [Salicibibacter kimchii]|uniref:MBL fold metallo-hydrolase n=1 Tax=Salicibibacter kimchii TaxID=2099786 RepID=A0A345C2D2_9BACI|nr:MBL fold metallo-hydrolase [Salicibibacter kimchii]AXF57363.1 MBL fold metallo-hydrolase [Salicibibacter kimchii]